MRSTNARAIHSMLNPLGSHPRQLFSIATAMCSQIAVAIDGLPTHTATDLFNLSQLNRSSLIVTMSDIASDDQIAHQISENSDNSNRNSDLQVAVAGAHTREIWSRLPLEIAVAIEDRCRGWGPLGSYFCGVL